VHCCIRKACTWRGAGSVRRVGGWIRGRAESERQGLSGREKGERGGRGVVGLGGVEQLSMPEEELCRACRR
jgi:hypothetical protein